MSKYLMTHSLLSSWLYSFKGNPFEDLTTAQRDYYEEFITNLERRPTDTTESMQKGIEFEDLVTEIVQGRGDMTHKWYGAAEKVAHIVDGGQLQYRARREITVAGMDLVLYGRLDALRAGVVYDIKFSGSYDRGKYIDSTQHPTYMEIVPEAHQFTYLVSNGNEVWQETYRRDETPSIIPTIAEFFGWLELRGLMDTYKEKWSAK